VLPLTPLALVLLHISPGVVLDVALLVSVFALLQASFRRSAMPGSVTIRPLMFGLIRKGVVGEFAADSAAVVND
jgi:hypothetical protein